MRRDLEFLLYDWLDISLADITTRAESYSDGTYRLTGTKMWTSAG